VEREDRLETLLDDLDELEKLLPRLCLELKREKRHSKHLSNSFYIILTIFFLLQIYLLNYEFLPGRGSRAAPSVTAFVLVSGYPRRRSRATLGFL
jgi:hypothetical protein